MKAAESSLQKSNRLLRNLVPFVFALLVYALAGCATTSSSRWFWRVPIDWSMKGQLPQAQAGVSFGNVTIEKNSPAVYVLIDGQAPFRNIDGNQATFRLTPGRHLIEYRYHEAPYFVSRVGNPYPLVGEVCDLYGVYSKKRLQSGYLVRSTQPPMGYGTSIYREAFTVGKNESVKLRVLASYSPSGFTGITFSQQEVATNRTRTQSIRPANRDSQLRQIWQTTQG